MADITDMNEANRFLKEVYIPMSNKRFAIKPQENEPSAMTTRLDTTGVSCKYLKAGTGVTTSKPRFVFMNTLTDIWPFFMARDVWPGTTPMALSCKE